MAEWQEWIHTYYLWYTPTPTTPTTTTTTLKSFIVQIDECLGLILGVFPSDLVCDLSLFWEMLLVLVFNTFSGNGRMARMAGLLNGGMVK